MEKLTFDGFPSLVRACRTVRRYKRTDAPTRDELLSFVDSARLSPSAANRQRLSFKLIYGAEADGVFSHISLGGYLPERDRPTVEMRPSAYIVLLAEEETPDTNLAIDIGICAQSIVLSATEAGYGTCMIRSFKRDGIMSYIKKDNLTPHLVIALGKADERVQVIKMIEGNVKYYREGDCNLVPKRELCDIVVD